MQMRPLGEERPSDSREIVAQKTKISNFPPDSALLAGLQKKTNAGFWNRDVKRVVAGNSTASFALKVIRYSIEAEFRITHSSREVETVYARFT